MTDRNGDRSITALLNFVCLKKLIKLEKIFIIAGIAPEQNPNRVLSDIHEWLIRSEP